MRFSLDETYFELGHLHPAEWHFLCELPAVASGREFGSETRHRLFPDPYSPEDYEDREQQSEFLSDWREFVVPDMDGVFHEARAQVQADLDGASVETAPQFQLPDDASPEQLAMAAELSKITWRKISIERPHAEEWSSTLNQARLLMNEAHGLADDENRYLNSPVDENFENQIDENRAMLLAQYEFYTTLQSILVQQLMEA